MTVNKIKLLLQSFLRGSIFYLLKFNFLTCAFLDGPKPGHLNSKTDPSQISSILHSQDTWELLSFLVYKYHSFFFRLVDTVFHPHNLALL